MSGGGISGNSNLQIIEAITQFVGGTQAVWNSITVPVPAGLVVYATDTTVVKMGDGTTLYDNLPTLFTISSIISLTNLVNSIVSSNASLLTDFSTLTTEYSTLLSAVTALQTSVNLVTSSTDISESGNVTVTTGMYFIGIANTTPAATVVTLPSSPVANERHVIKDMNGVAEAYNITIQGNGKTIDDAATVVLRTNFACLSLYWNGTSWSQMTADQQTSNVFSVTGNPNGQLAGIATSALFTGSPPDICWDGANFWVCTTTGTTSTAVWSRQSSVGIINTVVNLGTVNGTTVTLNRATGIVQEATAAGPITIALTGWLPGYSELVFELTNGGSTTITWPSSINWITSTGAVTSSFSSYGAQLQVSGTDFIAFFSPDGGTTVYGRVIR